MRRATVRVVGQAGLVGLLGLLATVGCSDAKDDDGSGSGKHADALDDIGTCRGKLARQAEQGRPWSTGRR